MANPANNPLFKHFRQPAVYLRLPSRGKFYPDEAIDFPVSGDIPVYPMTVKDELTLKTPDALMNGEGMAQVVVSCCPNIKDPWAVPAVDVDSIFIAIRLASYGEGMEIKTQCPHCKADNEHTIDLRFLLDNIKYADYSTPVQIEGLRFNFKPQTYKDVNDLNIISYEEQRLIEGIVNNPNLSDEEKAAKFKESFEKLNAMTVNSIGVSIDSILTEDGTTVNNRQQINEFLQNCSREMFTAIKQNIDTLINQNKMDPVNLSCEECTKEYQTNLTFDQSNFFG